MCVFLPAVVEYLICLLPLTCIFTRKYVCFLSAVVEASTSGFCHGSRQTARQTVHSAAQLKLPDNTTADIIYVFMSSFLEILLNSFLELKRWWDSTRGGLWRHQLLISFHPESTLLQRLRNLNRQLSRFCNKLKEFLNMKPEQISEVVLDAKTPLLAVIPFLTK